MVDASAVFAAKAEIQRRHAVVLQKRGVVRPRAERRNSQVRALADFFTLLRGSCVRDVAEPGAGPNAEFCFRVGDIPSHVVAEFFEGVRPFYVEIAAPVAVRIDVRYGVRAQFLVVLLGPFRRAKKPRLLAIPRAVNDGSLRLPARLNQLPKRPR